MTEHFVRPDARAFIELMKANTHPDLSDETIVETRATLAKGMALIDLPVGELAVVRDVVAPGPAGDIALRLYDARGHREPGPAMIFWHGGGWAMGGLDTHAAICAEFARMLDMPVIAASYRLAPEHPFPAAPDDAEAAARWIAENAAAFDRAFTSLVLSGDSAGGNLAIVTAMALRDTPAMLPVIAQFPIYPATDPLGRYPSIDLFGDGYALDLPQLLWLNQSYRPRPRDWRAAPLHGDHANMPATLVLAAGLDPLRDQSRAYAAALVSVGVPTVYREAAGNIHGFLTYRRAIPSSVGDVAAALIALRAMIREAEADRVMAQAAHGPAPVQTA